MILAIAVEPLCNLFQQVSMTAVVGIIRSRSSPSSGSGDDIPFCGQGTSSLTISITLSTSSTLLSMFQTASSFDELHRPGELHVRERFSSFSPGVKGRKHAVAPRHVDSCFILTALSFRPDLYGRETTASPEAYLR